MSPHFSTNSTNSRNWKGKKKRSLSPSPVRSPWNQRQRQLESDYDDYSDDIEDSEEVVEEEEVIEIQDDNDEIIVQKVTHAKDEPNQKIRYFSGAGNLLVDPKKNPFVAKKPEIPPQTTIQRTVQTVVSPPPPPKENKNTDKIIQTIGNDLDKGIVLLSCYQKESDDLEASIKALVEKRNNLRDRMDRIQKHIAYITHPDSD